MEVIALCNEKWNDKKAFLWKVFFFSFKDIIVFSQLIFCAKRLIWPTQINNDQYILVKRQLYPRTKANGFLVQG
jgi:hypothetical protein